MNKDKKIIEELGGTQNVAKLLGLDTKTQLSRVSNWSRRGIPAAVWRDHYELLKYAEKKVAEREARTN